MMIFSKFLKFVIVVLLIVAALYFRTHRLHDLSPNEARLIHKEAEERVVALLAAQIAPGVQAQFSHLASDEWKSLIAHQVEQIKKTDSEKFRKSVADVERAMLKARQGHFSPRYLSEADPYYYLKLTQNILETGHLGPEIKNGTFHNPLRYLPDGRWDPLTLHPYLGAGFHAFLSRMSPQIDLMTSLNAFPLVLVVLVIPAFFMLGRALKTSFSATALGALVFVLSPIVVQRSTYGWYDTDPYNFLIPTFVLATLFCAVREPRPKINIVWGGFAATLTAVFSLFWAGWAFVFLLTLGAVLSLIFLSRFNHPEKKIDSSLVAYASAYFILTIVFVLLFISPQGFLETLKSSFLFLLKAGGSAENTWPNFFVFIGETNSVTGEKLVQLVSNEFTLVIALIGAVAEAWRLGRQPYALVARRGVALFVFSLPLLFLAFKAERYVLLFVLPFSVFVAIGVDQIRAWGKSLLKKTPHYLRGEFRRKALVLGVCGLLIIPRTLIGGYVAARISHVIMNDAWYQPLDYLKKTSPPDSIVFSWWSPGHFVTAIAERKVAVDGGAQSLRENYWIAKALMSRDENESRAIFRMLAASGNQAQEWLERQGWPASRAVSLILQIIVLSSEQARQALPPDWTDLEKTAFIDLTHGTVPPAPSYVMVYDDLVQNNMLLQMVANWDFQKAENFHVPLQKAGKEIGQLLAKGQKGYVQRFLQIAGQPLPYQLNLKMLQKHGTKIFFENGLIVDSDGPKAYLTVDGPYGKGPVPVNLLYQQLNGEWLEDKPENTGDALLEVLVSQQDHAVMAVAAHRDLMQSLLFRLFYLDGRDTEYFQHISSGYESNSKTRVRIYQINW